MWHFLKGWCMVIGDDTKTSTNYLQEANLTGREDIIFLSADQTSKSRCRIALCRRSPSEALHARMWAIFSLFGMAQRLFMISMTTMKFRMACLAWQSCHGQRLIVSEKNSSGDSLAFNPSMRPTQTFGLVGSLFLRQRRPNSAARSRFASRQNLWGLCRRYVIKTLMLMPFFG